MVVERGGVLVEPGARVLEVGDFRGCGGAIFVSGLTF